MNPTRPIRTPSRARTVRRIGVVALGLTLGLGACGSDGDDGGSGGAGTAAFCDAVAEYREVVSTGDVTTMAGALEGSADDLPDGERRTVEAYVDSLTLPPPNQSPAASDTEERTAEDAFRSLAQETCGADALPPVGTTTIPLPDETTTTVTEPMTTTSGPGNSRNEPDDGTGDGETGGVDGNESYPSDTQPDDTEPVG